LSGQLARTYFMPFALVAVAAVARLRAALHQLLVGRCTLCILQLHLLLV
jgi:hypothetical protein